MGPLFSIRFLYDKSLYKSFTSTLRLYNHPTDQKVENPQDLASYGNIMIHGLYNPNSLTDVFAYNEEFFPCWSHLQDYEHWSKMFPLTLKHLSLADPTSQTMDKVYGYLRLTWNVFPSKHLFHGSRHGSWTSIPDGSSFFGQQCLHGLRHGYEVLHQTKCFI